MKIEGNVLVKVNSCDTKGGTFVIPDGISVIGKSAFSGCIFLRKIDIPQGVTVISDLAFADCANLKHITIPDTVTEIGRYAFWNCYNLKQINLPTSITKIGYNAFYVCEKLKSPQMAFKIFDANMICNGYQFEMGKWSNTVPDSYVFITNLFEAFEYFHHNFPDDNKIICLCEVGDKVEKNQYDSMCITNKIKPVRRLTREEIIKVLNGEEI